MEEIDLEKVFIVVLLIAGTINLINHNAPPMVLAVTFVGTLVIFMIVSIVINLIIQNRKKK